MPHRADDHEAIFEAAGAPKSQCFPEFGGQSHAATGEQVVMAAIELRERRRQLEEGVITQPVIDLQPEKMGENMGTPSARRE